MHLSKRARFIHRQQISLPAWSANRFAWPEPRRLPTEVKLSGVAPAVGTSLQFVFGTDDTSAFTSMISACSTKGCLAQLGSKAYMLTDSLIFPTDIPVEMVGAGPGVPNTANNYLGVPIKNTNAGTRLVFATQALTQAALVYSGGTTSTSATVNDKLADLALIAGAGINRDGGGSDGIDLINWQGFDLSNVYVFNFLGNGMDVGVTASSISTYGTKIKLDQLYSSFNNGYGLELTSGSAPNLETVEVDSSQIEANGLPGLGLLAGGIIQGFTLQNSVVQWNNINSPGAEMYIPGNVSACEVRGNYFEVDGDMGSQSTAWVSSLSASYDGCNYGLNILFPAATLVGGSVGSAAGDLSPIRHLTQASGNSYAGSCTMTSATTCSFTINKAYASTPLCFVTAQGTSTSVPASCSVSGTAVTVTAASSNSLTWAAALIGAIN